MRHTQLRFHVGFKPVIRDRHSQAAVMVIPPGDAEGGPGNRHRGADQWLYVVAGTGFARVEGTRYPLRAGSLVLIKRGEEHEVRCTGRKPLRTVNIYVPPAYRDDGEELPRGRR